MRYIYPDKNLNICIHLPSKPVRPCEQKNLPELSVQPFAPEACLSLISVTRIRPAAAAAAASSTSVATSHRRNVSVQRRSTSLFRVSSFEKLQN